MKNLIFLIFLIFSTYSFSSEVRIFKPKELGLNHQKLQIIDDIIQKKINDNVFPGAIILLSKNGKIFHFKTFGNRDFDKKIPVEDDTLFRIFSMTKPITSVAVMILYDRGLLSLDDPVTKFIPELKTFFLHSPNDSAKLTLASPPTIKHLLTHTSGITYGRPILGDSEVKSEYRKLNVRTWNQSNNEFINKISRLPLVFEPGTYWEYGHSTDVLARVVERVTGEHFQIFLKKNIFDPLHMDSTGYNVKKESLLNVAEQFKDKNTITLRDVEFEPQWFPGGHGLVSSAIDYWKFCQMLLNKGILNNVRILNESTVELMTKNNLDKKIKLKKRLYPLLPEGHGFGLGFAVRESKFVGAWRGDIGDFFWLGYAGTNFLISPKNNFILVFMAQQISTSIANRNMIFSLIHKIFE